MVQNHDADGGTPDDGYSRPSSPTPPRRKPKKQTPQESVKKYWSKFSSKYPGKAFTVLPENQYAIAKAAKAPKGAVQGQTIAKSYEEARAECLRDVERIIKECRRTNRKYRDPHFDIESDLKSGRRDCLEGLRMPTLEMNPKGVKRVTDIFENPHFYVNGPTAGDVRQGRDGDCYLMAALCGLGNMKGLIDRVCVIQDQAVGVYGFVFHRDGEWRQCIVDDKLYMIAPDYDEAQLERVIWNDISRKDTEEEYRKAHQTGSRALYFAQCSDEGETWLPMLEKAFAKAHGDFASIDGGFTGEAIEDLTGGVTSEFFSTDILDKDEFWHSQLRRVGKDFLFGCATGYYSTWLAGWNNFNDGKRKGIIEMHAYSIMDAVEIKGERLLKLRNPWGEAEWTGKWSDGSEEWTPEWMQLLNHRFGNDGIFWISYDDLLKKYQTFDRTRIFGPEWLITQQWTSVHIPWSADYLSTKFRINVKKYSPVVIVLSQLDRTYFRGLEGAYWFTLQFRVEKEGDEENDYIVRSNGNYAMSRSVSTDISLEAGQYWVLMKIIAYRGMEEEVEDALPQYAARRREKLIQIGLSHDLAHAKGVIVESDKEREERKAREKAKKVKAWEKKKKGTRARAEKAWAKGKKLHDRVKRDREKKERVEAKRNAAAPPPPMLAEFPVPPSGMMPKDVQEKGPRDGAEDPMKGDKSQSKVSKGELADSSAKPSEGSKIQSLIGESIGSKDANLDTSATVEKSAGEGPAIDDLQQTTSTANTPGSSLTSANEVVQNLDDVLAIADAESPQPPANTATLPLMPKIQINVSEDTTVVNVGALPNQPPVSSSAAADSSANPAAVQQGGGGGDAADVSDTDSYPDFDWQTDLDMESEPDFDVDSRASQNGDDDFSSFRPPPFDPGSEFRPVPPPPPPPLPLPLPTSNEDDSDSDIDEDDREPWNAVCVVGLRVYSQDPDLSLEVVRPRYGEEDDHEGTAEATLDRDDPAKGAAVETASQAGVE